jgi:Cu(I)/Ag(I) efflux system membrane fusion protein
MTSNLKLGIAAGFLIAWSLGYYLGQGNTPVAAPHPMQSFVNCTAETTDYYTCSMHLSLEQPEPGQCPACGMKLIKKRLLPQFNPDLVALSDAELLLSGVETQIAGDPKSSRGGIPVSGRLKIPPGQIRRQVAGLPGRIEALYITAEGDYVKKGAPIASIYSKDLIAVVEAFVHNTNSESILRAAKNNLKSWNLDLEVLQQFDVASGQYRHPVTISADYEGYVLEHFTHTGDYTANAHMGAPTTLYTIASLDKLWAVLEVYETQLSSIRLGSQVHLTTEAFPGERFGGKISFISPVVDPDTRTVEVRVELRNPGHRLKPEMLMEGIVALGTGPGHSPILLPRSAILWTGKRSVVYVRDSAFNQPVFRPRTVVLGPSHGDFYAIEDGLAPGEEIAVNGVFAIDAAAQLRGGRSMMSPGRVAEEPVAAQH